MAKTKEVQKIDTTKRDLKIELARFEGRVPAWMPKNAGETLHGTVEGYELRHIENEYYEGHATVIVRIRDMEGAEWNVFLFHQIMISEFERLKPKKGEEIAIRFDGAVEGRSNEYKLYTVLMQRDDKRVALDEFPELPPRRTGKRDSDEKAPW